MLSPIKRVWVPKPAQVQPAPPQTPSPTAAAPVRNGLFDDMPQPEIVEKNSDSIWAEFDSVIKADVQDR